MGSIAISSIAYALVFGGAFAGMMLRVRLPERQFSSEAQDVIKLGLGLIATMNALVLGLLVSTAKSSYDTRRAEVVQLASNALLLDGTLALYGPEAKLSRDTLRNLIASTINPVRSHQTVSPQTELPEVASPRLKVKDLYQTVGELSPPDELHRSLRAEALHIAFQIAVIRSAAFARRSSSIPTSLLLVLVLWLTILFVGFGLFAPLNATGLTAMFICAFSVSAAIFLILNMDQPFGGVIQLSSEPLRDALMILGR